MSETCSGSQRAESFARREEIVVELRIARIIASAVLCSAALGARAEGPLLLDHRTEGTGYAISWSTSAGVGGVIGTQSAECHHADPNGDETRPTSVVVTLEPRDGGYITFRYRFQSWYPTMGTNQGRANAFKIAIRNPATGAFETETMFEDYMARSCELRDTGWVSTSIYIRPWYDYSGPVSTRELVLTTFGEPRGSKDDPTYTGATTNSVEIDDLLAVCDSSTATAPEASSPRFTMRIPPAKRVYRTTAPDASPVVATCTGCCTKPLVPLDPNDADSVRMEASYDPWEWLPRCTVGIQTATSCFKTAVENAGYAFVLTATLRTAWYQKHFREVWDKAEDLKRETSPQCADIKKNVIAEKLKHGLAFPPAKGVNPRHVQGEAIDVSKKRMVAVITNLDALADGCGLYKRVPDDVVHYEVKP